MASRTAKKSEKKPWEMTFVNIELTEKEKAHVKSQKWEASEVLGEAERLVNDGYKVSLWADTYNDSVGATVSCPDESSPNYRKCISGRGPTLVGALAVLLFKHYTLCDGVWDTRARQPGTGDGWA